MTAGAPGSADARPEPSVADAPAASRFEASVGDDLAGYAEYRREGDGTLAFTHTVVDPAHEGQGVGSALVRGALDAARGAHVAVLPFCPFFRSWIERHPDYVELVPAGRRAAFGLPA